jgi:hypothetical protein
MSKSEANIQREIMMALSQAGCLVFRNNTGTGWQGKKVKEYKHGADTYMVLKNPRYITFGLVKGGSDLIGLCPDGKFLASEVKDANGKVTPEQDRFIAAVRAKGGRAGVARSVKDALEIANVGT